MLFVLYDIIMLIVVSGQEPFELCDMRDVKHLLINVTYKKKTPNLFYGRIRRIVL